MSFILDLLQLFRMMSPVAWLTLLRLSHLVMTARTPLVILMIFQPISQVEMRMISVLYTVAPLNRRQAALFHAEAPLNRMIPAVVQAALIGGLRVQQARKASLRYSRCTNG